MQKSWRPTAAMPNDLGASYIDALLLHNFMPGMDGFDEVVAWFVDLKRTGVIRRYGFSVEGDLAEGLSFLAQKGLVEKALVQTPVSDSLLNLPKEWRAVSIIAHSPFEFLRTHPEVARPLLICCGGWAASAVVRPWSARCSIPHTLLRTWLLSEPPERDT